MSQTVDYFFAPQSPWTYLGHARFVAMAQAAAVTVNVMPVDLGKVFPVSGGLPLARRAPQRQAYRLVDLKRFGDHLNLPINIQPKYFPVVSDDAARLIIAVDMADGQPSALRIAGAMMAAVWVQERNIADAAVLAGLLNESGLHPARLEQSRVAAVQQQYEAYTQAAVTAGVFGAPSYCIAGEMFWGQDRLDFVAQRLGLGVSAAKIPAP